jgi:hypothetical protein
MQSFNNWFSKRVKSSKSQNDVTKNKNKSLRLRSATEPNMTNDSLTYQRYTRTHQPPPAPRQRTTTTGSVTASITDSLKHLLMPPEDRHKSTRGTKDAKQMVDDIIYSYNSKGKITLSSYIQKYNVRGDLCTHRHSDLLLALVLDDGSVNESNRGELWLSASGGKKKMLQAKPGYFQKLCSPTEEDDEATLAAIKQIELDINRTSGVAEDNKDNNGGAYQTFDFASVSLSSLRKVLIATSRELPHVGYCQSMNFLAAMLLEQLEEEEAFWVLISIADDILKGYYTLSLLGCRVDQNVFAELVS